MKARSRKSARVKPAARGFGCQIGSCSLLTLPVEVLHQVLDLLDPNDLLKLLHTSKAMAVEVLQHSTGKMAFKVELCKGGNLAAIRHLQWAPPSTLKLLLDSFPSSHDWGSLMRSLHGALAACSSHQDQPRLQLPCFSEVCIQGFILPGLVPAGLVSMCPNLRALHLTHCTIQDGKAASSSSSSSSSSSRAHRQSRIGSTSSGSTGSNDFTGAHTATHLHTLVLQCVSAPCLKTVPAGNARATTSIARVTRNSTRVVKSLQAAEQYREQLRSSLPNLTCLTLVNSSDAEQMISMFELQLTELRLPGYERVSDMQWWQAGAHMQQLQTLVLPDLQVTEADIKNLLSLTSLIHVELGTVTSGFQEDFSSYPCKWQTLHLHLDGRLKRIDAIAKLPLHSLVQPLKLGCLSGEGVQLWLPPATEDDSYHGSLEVVAQRLGKCRVQVLEPHVLWSCDGPGDLVSQWIQLYQGAKHAHAITTVGPAIGLHARVCLYNIIVDQPILEALATVYGASLQQLVFEECGFMDDMLPAWHAALSGLPALQRLELTNCFYNTTDALDFPKAKVAKLVHQLAAAMMAQPDGRCIEVVYKDASGFDHYSSYELANAVFHAEDLLLGVEVTPQGKVHGMDSDDDDDDDDNDDSNGDSNEEEDNEATEDSNEFDDESEYDDDDSDDDDEACICIKSKHVS